MPEVSDDRRLGRYLVRRRLGMGGFARVYLGFDPDLDFEVAIKVLKAQFADDAAAVERFRREATTAVRLRHPNVVTVLAVGRLETEFDGSPAEAPYLVMDFLPDSLARRLEATPALPEREVRRIGAEVARGLAYAHQAGVVHRDIKPDNILFGRDGQAVVTDFGIARAVADTLSPVTRSAVVGTPSYFSPEQARGLPLDGRTDIYALGVTLYQAATGTLPFTGDDWYAVMRQHVEDAPVPPRERNASLSAGLDAIILRCLAKDPAARFPDAAALADALAAPDDGALERLPRLEARDSHPTVVVDPFEARRASERLRPDGAGTGRRWIVAGGAVGATLAGLAIWLVVAQSRIDAPEPLPGPSATAPDSLGAGGTPAVPAVAVDSPAGIGAGPGAAPSPAVPAVGRAMLAVAAPGGAEVRLNGAYVGRGEWRADSLAPGRYTVRASVASSPGCGTADTTVTVSLAAGQGRQLLLRPRGCGSLALVVSSPNPARYTVVSLDGGGVHREGSLPLARALVLPEGEYRLTVGAMACADYNADLEITPNATVRKSARLFC